MHITVNRLELLSAAKDAEQIVPSKSPLDVMECTYLTTENGKLTMAAGNLELALERRIPAVIHEEGHVVIYAGLLSSMLRLLSGEIVTIRQISKRYVSISSGQSNYQISVLDANAYPRMEIPFPEDSVCVSNIPELIKHTAFAVSTNDEAKPEMKCVHLCFSNDGLRGVGSDGFRIATAKGDSKAIGSVDMLVPAASLEKLAQLVRNKDKLHVGTTGKAIVFLKDDFAFSARLVSGSYFNADQLMSQVQPSFAILTDAEQLRQTMAAAFSVMGTTNRFSITFCGTKLRVRCESEFGASCAEKSVVPLTGTPAGEYWYNPVKLLECLRAQSGTLILELAQNGALIMRTDELVCMQLAIREPRPIEIKPRETKVKEPGAKEVKAKAKTKAKEKKGDVKKAA